jgi:hypothetical protein
MTGGRFYWDNQVKHDRPLITNCYVPGLAYAAGLKPSSATEEQDLDMVLTNIALADQEERPLSFPETITTFIATSRSAASYLALRR